MLHNKKIAGIFLLFFGALAGLGDIAQFGWLLTIPFVIALSWLWIESKAYSTKQKILLTWLSGYVYFLTLQSWMLSFNISGIPQLSPIGIESLKVSIWMLSCLFWSSGFLLLGFVYNLFSKQKYKIHTKYIVFSITWSISEYARSIFFSIFNIGDGSTIGAYGSYGSLGLLVIDTPLKYSSRIIGLYGSTFLFLVFIYAVYIIYRKNLLNRYLAIMLLMPIVFTFLGWFYYRESRSFEHEVTIVHAPFQEDSKSTVDADFGYYPSDTSGNRLIILPEYSNIFSSKIDPRKRGTILSSFSTPNGENYFIDAYEIPFNGGAKLELGLYDSNSRILQNKTKSLLVPYGEYLPFYLEGFFKLLKLDDVLSTHEANWKIIKGDGGNSFVLGREKIGAFSCSSILSTEDYRISSNQGASLLTNSADLGLFNMSKKYIKSNIKLAKFHATANNRPFVQVARQGVSFIIEKNGNNMDFLVEGEAINVKNYSLITSDKKTIYTKYGDYFIALCLSMVTYLIIRKSKYFKKVIVNDR